MQLIKNNYSEKLKQLIAEFDIHKNEREGVLYALIKDCLLLQIKVRNIFLRTRST